MSCPAKLEKTTVIYTLVNNAFYIRPFDPVARDLSLCRQVDKSSSEGKRRSTDLTVALAEVTVDESHWLSELICIKLRVASLAENNYRRVITICSRSLLELVSFSLSLWWCDRQTEENARRGQLILSKYWHALAHMFLTSNIIKSNRRVREGGRKRRGISPPASRIVWSAPSDLTVSAKRKCTSPTSCSYRLDREEIVTFTSWKENRKWQLLSWRGKTRLLRRSRSTHVIDGVVSFVPKEQSKQPQKALLARPVQLTEGIVDQHRWLHPPS